jgi:hypothetical protein
MNKIDFLRNRQTRRRVKLTLLSPSDGLGYPIVSEAHQIYTIAIASCKEEPSGKQERGAGKPSIPQLVTFHLHKVLPKGRKVRLAYSLLTQICFLPYFSMSKANRLLPKSLLARSKTFFPLRQGLLAKNVLITAQRNFSFGNSLQIPICLTF